jgi:iron complex transport system substrate-binding protein
MRYLGWMLLTVAVATAAPRAARAGRFPVTLHDATGVVVTIPRPPRRIVSLAPSVTEILFALGLDQEIVGVGDADDYPPDRLQTKERIGGVLLNVERIVALRPELVVGMPSLQRDQLTRLRTLRLPVLAVDASSLSETVAQIRLLGQATGRARQADDLAGSIERRTQTLHPVRAVRVYVEVWDEPVIAAAAGTLVDDLVRRGGGQNVLADKQGYVQVPLETVLMRNPQVIFLLYPGRARLLARPGWQAVAARQVGRIYELPPSLVTRPGPRIVEGLARVSRLLQQSH